MIISGILIAVLAGILLMLVILTYYLHALKKQHATAFDETDNPIEEEKREQVGVIRSCVYAAIVLVSVTLVGALYMGVKGTIYEGHVMEWMNIVVRLMHITFGIAWIGASFYFVFLENALNRTKDVRQELAGNLWAVHGGGFYYVEKYKVAPKEIPKDLHWFKYEAYFTWLTGFSLLFVVYYFNASAMLIDKNVWDIPNWEGICIGIGSFILAWLIYATLCKTPLVKKGLWFAIIGFLLCTGFAYFYAHVFNSRAAYIHLGAMIGTLMVGNVFFVIIPAQKAMVKAAKEGSFLNPELGKHAGLRSLHNNYFTLPVLFVMVSNHFPSTFGNDNPWLILAIFSLGVAGVKHYLNLKEKGQLTYWVMPVSVLILLSAAYISAPQKEGECRSNVSFEEVNKIVQKRCVACHSSHPTDDVYTKAPNGVMYDTPEAIVKLKDKIMQRVVITKTMPQNNKTNITQKERDMIRCWIDQGASIK
ncbi:urate hydroxylase PuuD [Parasediminibacterium sp. JCM 36343]|uniref:urate hydroxylase PuuD n=1 Tax=Parasediminibacterium sp. JCM 36343 TaxID=3374279 RepID=UPI00397C2086